MTRIICLIGFVITGLPVLTASAAAMADADIHYAGSFAVLNGSGAEEEPKTPPDAGNATAGSFYIMPGAEDYKSHQKPGTMLLINGTTGGGLGFAAHAGAADPGAVPIAAGGDIDCPAMGGPVWVFGSDTHRLDADDDGVGCE